MPSFKLPFSRTRPVETAGTLTKADALSKDELIGKNSQTQTKYQQLLTWHGIETNIVGAEFIGDCPFHDCPSFIDEKPNKFSMNRQTGEWRCFVCERKGNAFTLLPPVHQNWLDQTTPEHYKALIALRKGAIDVEELQEMQFAFNGKTQEWMCPAFNVEGKLTNIYVYRKIYDQTNEKMRQQFMSSPLMKHVAYGIHKLRPGAQRPILVCEGQWDYLAICGLLRRVNKSFDFDVLAAPGAGTFPHRDLEVFNGRRVILLFDNDQAGIAGMDKITDAMARKPVMPIDCKKIVWPAGLPKGFDISDAITSLPQALWKVPKKK